MLTSQFKWLTWSNPCLFMGTHYGPLYSMVTRDFLWKITVWFDAGIHFGDFFFPKRVCINIRKQYWFGCFIYQNEQKDFESIKCYVNSNLLNPTVDIEIFYPSYGSFVIYLFILKFLLFLHLLTCVYIVWRPPPLPQKNKKKTSSDHQD
jgi:hypothetical protein